MKILMLGRIDLFEKPGGDTVQINNTAQELRNLGLEVDIKTDIKCDMSSYDLVHIFQLDWIPEIYFFVKNARRSSKKIVFSAIHHNIDEVRKFDDIYAFDFRRISRVLFKDQFHRDTFKNVYRSIFDRRRLLPTFFSVLVGFKNMQRRILLWSDVVLVQTDLEAADLKRTFDVDVKCVRVSNGVGKNYLVPVTAKNPLSISDYIICVGRIEPRKNQLSIIKAAEALRNETGRDIKLVFVGYLGEVKHFEYAYKFKKELESKKWITHISKVPYIDMPLYYKYAKVCVSASWFETTGLTSLEALYCGTNAVASGERAKECLGNYASYCLPDDINSIKEAVKKEFFAPRPNLDDNVKKEYTWENAARKTLEVYNNVLKNNK
jgi:glycosyltransferase involved in cell wall biosynthesis